MRGVANDSDTNADGIVLQDWRNIPGEKGTLLYRDVFTLRYVIQE